MKTFIINTATREVLDEHEGAGVFRGLADGLIAVVAEDASDIDAAIAAGRKQRLAETDAALLARAARKIEDLIVADAAAGGYVHEDVQALIDEREALRAELP